MYENFPDTLESMGEDVHPPSAAATPAETATAPAVGLVSKTLVLELLMVNQFIVTESGQGPLTQTASLAAWKELLTFVKEVVTSCWKEDSPTVGTSTAGRGYAPSRNSPIALLENKGEGKQEEASVLALT